MRIIAGLLGVLLLAGCASGPVDEQAYARAQALCGDYEVVDDGPPGSREYRTRQDERFRCLLHDIARNSNDRRAIEKAFDDVVASRSPES